MVGRVEKKKTMQGGGFEKQRLRWREPRLKPQTLGKKGREYFCLSDHGRRGRELFNCLVGWLERLGRPARPWLRGGEESAPGALKHI